MKKYISFILSIIFLACSNAWAGGLLQGVVGGGVPAASVGNIFSENFEANPGYDNADWTEVVGAGSTVNEDSTAVTPPTGGGSQVLLYQKVSLNFNALTRHELATITKGWTTLYFQYGAHGLTTTSTYIFISDATDVSAGAAAWELRLLKTATGVCIQYQILGTATEGVTTPDIAANTWYKLGIKFNADDDTYDFSWDQGTGTWTSLESGSLPAGHKDHFDRIRLGDNTNAYTITGYIDKLEIDNAAYK